MPTMEVHVFLWRSTRFARRGVAVLAFTHVHLEPSGLLGLLDQLMGLLLVHASAVLDRVVRFVHVAGNSLVVDLQ